MPQCDKASFAYANAAFTRRFGSIRYSAAMASENDDKPADHQAGHQADTGAELDKLARRYLDLWQTQLAGLSSDQAVTEQIARLFAAANAQVASAMHVTQGATHAGRTGWQSPPTPNGTQAAAAASGNGADDVGELRKRLEALEARVAELESRLATP